MPKRKFTKNEQLVIRYELADIQRRSKVDELNTAMAVVGNYENIQATQHPKVAWEALVQQLNQERTEVEKKLSSISTQMEKKHIDTSSSTFFSAKQTAAKQSTLSPFFKKPALIHYDAQPIRLDI